MAAVAPTAPVFAVTVPPTKGGTASYTLASGLVWRLQALSFTADLTGSVQADDIFVRILDKTAALIVGEVPGSSQASGSTVAYTLAPDLNPCDSITSAFLNLTPDRFTPLTLAGGCQILIEARAVTTGTLDTAAKISNGLLWAEDLSAAASTAVLPPIFIPVPIKPADQIAAGVGAITDLF